MRIAFWGNFGTYNLGNECTLRAMLEATRRLLPQAELVVLSNGPADTTTRHKVEALAIPAALPAGLPSVPAPFRQLRRFAIEAWDWRRTLQVLRSVDRLVITGTGMLADRREGAYGAPYQLLKWVAAARLLGTQVAFVSVGAEKLSQRRSLALIGAALRLASYRSYRDPLSKKRADRYMRKATNDPVYPDLAFSLPKSLITGARAAAVAGLGVAVGIYGVDGGDAAVREYVEMVGAFVLWLLERGRTVRIVIGDMDYDLTVHARLHEWLSAHGVLDRVVDTPARTFVELMGQLAQADLVVATRFHNLVLSLLLGKPVISVSHMDKNDELMAAMGLASYCLPLSGLNPAELRERVLQMEREAEPLKRAIDERAALWRDQLERQYEALFGLQRSGA